MPLTTQSLSGHPTGLGSASVILAITRPTVFRGQAVDIGDTFDNCTEAEARLLIGCAKAVRVASSSRLEAGGPRASALGGVDRPRETAALDPVRETRTGPVAPSTETVTVAEDTGSGFERLVDVPAAPSNSRLEAGGPASEAPRLPRASAVGGVPPSSAPSALDPLQEEMGPLTSDPAPKRKRRSRKN